MKTMDNGFRVYSNYREIETFGTLADAKAFALKESTEFDDIVRIDSGGFTIFFAQYATLYRAHILR